MLWHEATDAQLITSVKSVLQEELLNVPFILLLYNGPYSCDLQCISS